MNRCCGHFQGNAGHMAPHGTAWHRMAAHGSAWQVGKGAIVAGDAVMLPHSHVAASAASVKLGLNQRCVACGMLPVPVPRLSLEPLWAP